MASVHQAAEKPGGGLLIAIGRLGRPHGVRGEIKLSPFFGHGLVEEFVGRPLYVDNGECAVKVVLESSRAADKVCIVAFEGIETPESVAEFTGRALQAPRARMPSPPDGKYYYEEIIGLPVFDLEGNELGRLADFFEAGSSDVWVIRTGAGEEIMTPCIPETLIAVDLPGGRIIMKLMEME